MKYYDEVPIIRSVAAMLVVAIHTVNSIALSGGTFTSDGLGYVNQIARLGTPIFAVISAFLLTISVVNKGFNLDYFVNHVLVKYLFLISFGQYFTYYIEPFIYIILKMMGNY